MNNLVTLVDEIGALKAKLAPDLAKLKEKEEELKSLGKGRYSGVLLYLVTNAATWTWRL